MSGDVTPYTNIITSQYVGKPKFLATVTATAQGFADAIALLLNVPTLFDLDQAVGSQLDICGQWIGVTRNLLVPLSNVFFSFDTAGLGFDQGIWETAADINSGGVLYALHDDQYRTLLKVQAAANQWDGTAPGAYDVWAQVFSTIPGDVQILDANNGNVTFNFSASLNATLDNVTKQLLLNFTLLLKPMCVILHVQGITIP